MKNLKETEELFDGIFKETLENGTAQVPTGVWEGVSASIGSGSAIAGAAVKTALWMKAAIAAVAISAVALISYQLAKEEPVKPEQAVSIKQESTETQTPALVGTNNSESTDNTIQGSALPHSKNNNNKGIPQEPPVQERDSETPVFGGPDQIYSMDANLVNPMIDHSPSSTASNKEEKPTENPETPQQKEVKELNPTTEYTYFKDSSSIFIPTAVTADGDGINDTYIINLVGEESVEIIIYSIENEVLFRTTNKYQAWNCKLPNGDDAPAGSYLVKVIYKFKGKEKQTTVRKLTVIK